MTGKLVAAFSDNFSVPFPFTRRRKYKSNQPLALTTLKSYWSFTKNYRREITYALGALPGVILIQNGILPLIYSRALDQLHQQKVNPGQFGLWLTMFVGLHLAVFACQRVAGRYWSKIEHSTIKDIEQHIFRKLIEQSSSFHASTHAGGLVAQAKRFTGAFSNLMGAFYHSLYALVFRIVIAFGSMLFISPLIAGILIAWTVLYTSSILWLTRRKMHASEAAAQADSGMTARLADTIGNVSSIKLFGNEKQEAATYAGLSQSKYTKRRYDWLLGEIIIAWQSLLMIALEAVVLSFSVQMVLNGTITVGKLALMQFFLAPILLSLWQIAGMFRQIEGSLADAREMTETLASKPDVKDPVQPRQADVCKGQITFRHVNFSYGTSENHGLLFSNLCLEIPAGQKVGLVGPSGGGKTSLTKLLLRLMDVAGGSISIDGQDIAQLKQSDLRKQIAVVPQEPQLFHRTISENIRYGKPDASDEEVISAATRARAHEFIEKLPEGYETLVGERGTKLSGGERQRIASARALLKNAPIVILDEATSALDSGSEQLVHAAFQTLMQNRTALVIAHRMSTIKHMDRILVLRNGSIEQDGSHQELIAQGGLYQDLWQRQHET